MRSSIKRAEKLLDITAKAEEYISLKLKTSSCCCIDHCIPDVYSEIKNRISPLKEQKVKSDEIDILLKKNGDKYVLEFHESGPELIFYATVSGLAVAAIAGLAKMLICSFKSSQKFQNTGTLKIIKRRLVKNKVHEEEIIEIQLSSPVDLKAVENTIKDSLQNIKPKKLSK